MTNTFIDASRNDPFFCLRGLDLKELLFEIDNFYLEYRNTLNLPQDITFGPEIEVQKINRLLVTLFIKINLKTWSTKKDESLTRGIEIINIPTTDNSTYWKELKKVCKYLNRKGADTIYEKDKIHGAGGHIHVGAHILGEDKNNWLALLKLYAAYEHVLYRFSFGDKINDRKVIKNLFYSQSFQIRENLKKYNKLKEILYNLTIGDRNCALNFQNLNRNELDRDGSKIPPNEINEDNKHLRNTLEFRLFASTVNEIILQNNINTVTKMMDSSRKGVMDIEYLDYKLKHEFYTYWGDNHLYNGVCLKEALEFVDLVFDNNLDKVYFLKQYLKNLENNYGLDHAIKAKRITK